MKDNALLLFDCQPQSLLNDIDQDPGIAAYFTSQNPYTCHYQQPRHMFFVTLSCF